MFARAKIIVQGKVQGVFYRVFTQKNALKLGLKGWTRNLPNGDVEIICEGDKESIEELIKKLWEGPPLSKVDNVEICWEEYKSEFKDFTIKY
ncbi:acylphosphatase [Candidatus Methanoliparum sp. LAM-1]|uniref:acylphosphatase n=1 Tax=Candidatus Methanoliparum sp. LAM-1 TaxID=2874846 RepID=UPI001E4B6452|nr:acylphosphatase [Candidatus Methanoliparum sp. LAM-1]BDC35435.1 acylphosphatase [Candidatus Methanoliparum sp. LAM-1]